MPVSDLARRIAAVENRLDWLDEHGTRGVDGLRIQMVEQAKVSGALCEQMKQVDTKLTQIDGARWQRFTAYALAILPVYVLLFLAIMKSKG